jgi:hypothetical protein
MELSYPLRLVCLIAVSMAVLQILFELLLWLAASPILRAVRSLTLRRQERVLYLLHFVPVALSLAITALCWVPEYVANETNFASEEVGSVCLVIASLLFTWWAVRAVKAGVIAMRTLRFSRACRRNGTPVSAGDSTTPIVAVPAAVVRAGLVGILRPFIFISKSLLDDRSFAPVALGIVLAHERAHARQHDNLKLLTLHCLPRLNLRLASGKTWMQHWQNAAEWAADEDAVHGDRGRALLLAETLIVLARSTQATQPQVACTYFVCEQSELAQRIERLLQPRSNARSGAGASYRILAACAVAVAATTVVLVNVAALLHDVPERLLHLG